MSVACGAGVACHPVAAAACAGRAAASRSCVAARSHRGAALRVRASRASSETGAVEAPPAAHVAASRRGVLAAGAALLLPVLGSRADDIVANPEPLGNGARCAWPAKRPLGCRLTHAVGSPRAGLMRFYGRATSSSSCACPLLPRRWLALAGCSALHSSEPRCVALQTADTAARTRTTNTASFSPIPGRRTP